MSRPLTHADKMAAFKIATSGFACRYAERGNPPMTDAELDAALEEEMGTLSGSSCPGRLSVTCKGSGLRIWASWESCYPLERPPIFSGAATRAMAREVYGVADPKTKQLSLF